MTKTWDEALRLWRAGWNVIPALLDGRKRPALAWDRYRQVRVSMPEVMKWFANPRGLGVIGGGVSGGAEQLDFDDHQGNGCVFSQWGKLVGLDLVRKLVIYRTPSNGWRACWRCRTYLDGGKLVLARRSKDEAIIELLANQFVVVPGGDVRAHQSCRPYTYWRGDLAEVQEISPDERERLLEASRSFNQWIAPFRPEKRLRRSGGHWWASDDFNGRGDWEKILTGAMHPEREDFPQWRMCRQRGNTVDWTRPGKRDGVSATSNYYGNDMLHVFTSSTVFEADSSYTKYAAYTFLYWDGDFSRSAKELARLGYGLANSDIHTLMQRVERLYSHDGDS